MWFFEILLLLWLINVQTFGGFKYVSPMCPHTLQKRIRSTFLKLYKHFWMLIGTQCELQKCLIPTKMNYLKTLQDDPFLLVFILKLCQKLCGTVPEISELSPQCFKYIFFTFLYFPAKLSYKKIYYSYCFGVSCVRKGSKVSFFRLS